MRISRCSILLACTLLIGFSDGSARPSPPGSGQSKIERAKGDKTNPPVSKEPPPWAVSRIVSALKRGSNLIAMEAMLQITVLSRVKSMPMSDLIKAPIAKHEERKALAVLASSWDEMIETMKKERLTPLRPIAVTTIYTEALPDNVHFRRETLSFYGVRPVALLPELLSPKSGREPARMEDPRLIEEAMQDSVGWNTIVNRIRGIGSDPDFAPDLDVLIWITYLGDRQRDGKTDKDVVTRELRFAVRNGEIQSLPAKR